MIPRAWLLTSEYCALTVSGIAAIGAIVTQQALWAAPPLTLSLALNAINRESQFRRIDQTQEQLRAASDLHSRRINQIEMGLLNLQASLSENPEASQAEDFQRLMEDLQGALNRLKGE